MKEKVTHGEEDGRLEQRALPAETSRHAKHSLAPSMREIELTEKKT
jgi:hypothetical protein